MRAALRVALVSLAVSVGTVHGEFLTILNPSFEDPVTDRNGTSLIPGWQNLDTSNNGIWRPASTDFASIPDGMQVAYVQTDSIYQIIGDVLAANTRYDLQIAVGHAYAEPLLPGEWAVQLRAGGEVLAEVSDPTPGRATFINVGLTYFAKPGNSALGKKLEIWLIDRDPDILRSDVNFDNVRLSATRSAAVPEPGSLTLACGGLAALFAVRAMRRPATKITRACGDTDR